MPAAVRLMNAGDVLQAESLSAAAGWNQTLGDWRTLIQLSPDGCFAIDCEGELAATTTLTRYSRQLAWIGMVLTHTKYRGRGFARSLMNHALRFADSSDIETVKLDATDMGQSLYKSLGFEVEQPLQRLWRLQALGSVPRDDSLPQRLPHQLRSFDARAFGADRWSLLELLAQQGRFFCGSGAYLFTRPGRLARYLGPCVAIHPKAAEQVIGEAIAYFGDEALCWDLLSDSAPASAIARSHQFSVTRKLVRMRRGLPQRAEGDLVYGIAGFELG